MRSERSQPLRAGPPTEVSSWVCDKQDPDRSFCLQEGTPSSVFWGTEKIQGSKKKSIENSVREDKLDFSSPVKEAWVEGKCTLMRGLTSQCGEGAPKGDRWAGRQWQPALPPLQPLELLPPLLFTLLSFAMKDDDVCASCIDCAS